MLVLIWSRGISSIKSEYELVTVLGSEVEIQRLLADAMEIGKKLSSPHASSIILDLSNRPAFVELGLLRAESLVDLMEKPVDSEVERLEQHLVANFFFMRESNLVPLDLAVE
jgi:hypothetical protein